MIALTANDDKRIQLIDLVERYACKRRKDLVCKREKIQSTNVIKQFKNDLL